MAFGGNEEQPLDPAVEHVRMQPAAETRGSPWQASLAGCARPLGASAAKLGEHRFSADLRGLGNPTLPAATAEAVACLVRFAVLSARPAIRLATWLPHDFTLQRSSVRRCLVARGSRPYHRIRRVQCGVGDILNARRRLSILFRSRLRLIPSLRGTTDMREPCCCFAQTIGSHTFDASAFCRPLTLQGPGISRM